MAILVSGATGFVMSVFARHWLETDPSAKVIALDASPPDVAAQRYFSPVSDRLTLIVADVTKPESWRDKIDADSITHIVHGATVTPLSSGMPEEAKREPEAERPGHIIDVNVMGTIAVLDWARRLPKLQRFLYVSSGSVYKHHGPDRPGEPLPEDGYVMPRQLYGISKLASELITERYADLFGLPTVSVRLSSVYGTMDRATASRVFRHVPNRIAHMALSGEKTLLTNTLDAVGDYVHSEDVAAAIAALLKAATLRHSVYNIAAGEVATIGDLVAWAAEKVPGFTAEVVTPEQARMLEDASLTGGMWGAYDIARITAATGWKPRPTREAFHAYMDWIATEGEAPQP